MKRGKTNIIIKLAVLFAAILIVLVLLQKVEGFQAGTVVTLYYGVGADLKPIFISSSNPGITPTTTGVGVASVSVSPNLGTLKRYTGYGYSTNQWVQLVASKLDRGVGSFFLSSGEKTIHNPTYIGTVLATSTTEVKLPATGLSFTTLKFNNLTGTNPFPFIGAGDTTKTNAGVNAKIRIDLTF
jgi:hypothetical protein